MNVFRSVTSVFYIFGVFILVCISCESPADEDDKQSGSNPKDQNGKQGSVDNPPDVSAENFTETVVPFFGKHCVSCHGPDKAKGGLRVDRITAGLDDLASLDHMLNIVDYLVTDEMPPEDEPRPDARVVTEVIKILSNRVELAQQKHSSGGGKPVRRLTRTEYINTVQDLLGVYVTPTSLPADGSIGAFETEARSLYTTDMHLDTYLNTSREVVRRFIASRNQEPGTRGVEISANPSELKKKEGQLAFKEIPAELIPAAGHLIHRLTFWQRDPKPENRLYVGDKHGGPIYEVTGTPTTPQRIDVPIYEPAPSWKWRYLEDLSNVKSRTVGYEVTSNKQENKRRREAFLKSVRRVKVTPENIVEVQSLEVEHPVILGKTEGIQVFNPQPYNFFRPFLAGKKELPEATARAILRRFVELINRGQALDDQLIENLYQVFLQGREQGAPFWEAITEPMAVAMCSLQFLFHFEDREGDVDSVSGIELANRLSYYLWRSAPDSRLLARGRTGKLLETAVFNSEIERMMNDERFERFLNGFTRQWLELDRQDMIAVDVRLYPEFNERWKYAIKGEAIAFLSQLVRDDLPLRNLIDSDFMTLNGVMATHYGIPGVSGDEFRVVARRPEDTRRGGLLTQAGILMQTSTGERTSIVERGVFIAEKILNDEPPPPPANVAALDSGNADTLEMTAAEMMRHHRSTPQCASCHNAIDPLGLGLEEFDVVGLRRDIELRIDPAQPEPEIDKKGKLASKVDYLEVDLVTGGSLPDGTDFHGIEGLKHALLPNRNLLAEAYVEALLSFANGRKAGAADGQIVEEILASTRENDYPAGSILTAVLRSSVFRSGKNPSVYPVQSNSVQGTVNRQPSE